MIDLLDPDLHASGGALVELARLPPVSRTRGRHGPGYWSVTGHAELCAAARDHETFSSYWGTRPEVSRPDGALRPLHNLDAPAHAPMRAVAEAALDALPSAVRVAEIVRMHVARIDTANRCEVVRVLAEPIPSLLFSEWLGVPTPARLVVDVHEAGAALLDTAAGDASRPERQERARAASAAIGAFFEDALVRADRGALAVIARQLSGAEAVALAALLVEAGLPTVTDAIASAIADLVAHPDVVAATKHATARARALLVEELFRRASPIVQFARRARHDVVLGGETVRAGEQIVLWFAAANRDPRVFRDPDRLEPARLPNPHVAFGVGPHACLGARFARVIVDALVAAWCDAVGPGARIVDAKPRRSSYLRGYTELWVAS